MASQWKLARAIYNSKELKSVTGFPESEAWRLYNHYCKSSVTAKGVVDTETALGTLAHAEMTRVGLDPSRVLGKFYQVMHSALTHLAMQPGSIKVDGGEEAALRFAAFLDEGTEHQRVRRLQELLGIHERAAKRFMIQGSDGNIRFEDSLEEFVGRDTLGAFKVIDGHALANKLLAYRPDAPLIAHES